MNDIFSLTLLLVLALACLVAFFSLLGVFFSARIARIEHIAAQNPGRALLVGLVNLVFFAAVLYVLGQIAASAGGLLVGIGGLLLAALALGWCLGLAALVQLVGGRLAPARGGILRTLCGTASLGLASAIPFVGWFGVLGLVSLLGLGASILSLFRQSTPAQPVQLPAL